LIVGSAFEAPANVPCLDDFEMMSEAVEQRGRHLGIREDARPFTEGQVAGHDDPRALRNSRHRPQP
jgi:hypothetical protein